MRNALTFYLRNINKSCFLFTVSGQAGPNEWSSYTRRLPGCLHGSMAKVALEPRQDGISPCPWALSPCWRGGTVQGQEPGFVSQAVMSAAHILLHLWAWVPHPFQQGDPFWNHFQRPIVVLAQISSRLSQITGLKSAWSTFQALAQNSVIPIYETLPEKARFLSWALRNG